jgi:hypothetical protein
MCVARTARRKRKQALQDKRYKQWLKDPTKRKRNLMEQVERAKARAERKAGK